MSKKYRFSSLDIDKIQNFVDSFFYDLDIVIEKGSRYECDLDEQVIYLGSKRYTHYDEEWFKCFNLQPQMYNSSVIALLHEIGHFMTYDPQLNEERDFLEEMLLMQCTSNIISEKEMNEYYFVLPSEKQASMWAINFYNSNKEICEDLAKSLGV